MNRFIKVILGMTIILGINIQAQAQPDFRPPAYPLITVDPYFSIWSFNDQLYNGPTHHWTEKVQSLQGIIRVDGKAMYFMGQPIPQYRTILPLVGKKGTWNYTFDNPGRGWERPDFNDSGWKGARGAFSDHGNAPNAWKTHDIWVRRTFNLKDTDFNDLLLNLHHDDNVTVYLNGVKAYEKEGWVSAPEHFEISPRAQRALHTGNNVLAIHCENTAGGAYLDAGLVDKVPAAVKLSNARQTSVKVTATQTKYQFNAGGVTLNVTFTAPLLPDQLDVLSRPANYITFNTHSNDGKDHDVQIYFSAAGNMAVNTPEQKVVWQRMPDTNLDIMRIGTDTQQILGRKGDNVRIDWGYLYLTAPRESGTTSSITENGASIKDFVQNGTLTRSDDSEMPRAANNDPVTLATSFDLGSINKENNVRHAILAYDDLYSVEYFNHPLVAWWKRNGTSVVGMLNNAEKDYHQLLMACDRFDQQLTERAEKAGGAEYERLASLSYRQAVAAHKLVAGPDGKPLFFSKENFSNGSIGTVDVTYPSSPIFLYYNPELLKGMLRPIFYYSESGKWTEPFAAHDVGTYPIANGQTYGEDMPIEEAGNMIILTTAIAKIEGNASFAAAHWQTLTTWANYLLDNGLDPKNQLCTDDFAGHLAHNANLSVKAIVGIAGYGKLAEMQGKDDIANKYISAAHDMAQKWTKMDDAGDHYGLTFDREGTWSQKYNLVWDKVMDLNLFPDQVVKKEVAYYLKKQNKYGLPLDNRATYTKSDWIMWTATLSPDETTFQKFINPLYKSVSETSDRVPMTDWYQTTDASQVGFQARSVVGGYFMKMLDRKMHNKD